MFNCDRILSTVQVPHLEWLEWCPSAEPLDVQPLPLPPHVVRWMQVLRTIMAYKTLVRNCIAFAMISCCFRLCMAVVLILYSGFMTIFHDNLVFPSKYECRAEIYDQMAFLAISRSTVLWSVVWLMSCSRWGSSPLCSQVPWTGFLHQYFTYCQNMQANKT
jgi:hypothetical protein